MTDKAHRATERVIANDVALAHTQAAKAIGEAAVALHSQGKDISTAALIAELLQQAQAVTGRINQEKLLQAARLLGWSAEPVAD